MNRLSSILLVALTSFSVTAALDTNCPPFSSALIEFTSQFQQPSPPVLRPEFNASFIQHKWNENLSHIATGYIYNSPSLSTVRAEDAYPGILASSVFNFGNISEGGLVDNMLTTFTRGCCEDPQLWEGYVNSDFPLIQENFLVDAGAVFTGLVNRDLTHGLVAAWGILYQGIIPVTVYVDAFSVLVGYDYFFPVDRTRVVTTFFNIDTTPSTT